MTLHNHNGTLVIHNPEGEYDYEKLVEEWKDKMDELPPLPINLDSEKLSAIEYVESQKDVIFRNGFDYDGERFTSDSEAQSNLIAYVMRDGRGTLVYPQPWFLPNGGIYTIQSSSNLIILADIFQSFKVYVYKLIMTTKSNINSSEDVDGIKKIIKLFDDEIAILKG